MQRLSDRAHGCPATDQGTSIQATRRNNLSVECTTIFPRRLRIAPLLCHSLKIRLVVYGVIFAALANSSFVISNSMPPETLWPMLDVYPSRTLASLCRAVWEHKAA